MKRIINLAVLAVFLGAMTSWAGDTTKNQESYLKKAENEVQEWTVKLKSLQERSEKSGTKSRQQLDEQVKVVNEKLDSVRKDLDRLRVSTGTSWKPIRQGLEDALRDLKRDYRKAMSYFDKQETKEKS
jgi:archaellum component FlaC